MRPLALVSLLTLAISISAQDTHEQILIPFDSMTLPTGGATWRADLFVRNNGETAVNLWPDVCYPFGLAAPCERRIDISAMTTRLLDVIPEPNATQPGVLLYVPRNRTGDVTFNLRIRDLRSGSIGTEIPVVRESEMRRGATTLINIPLQLNGRVDLRLYSPDAGATYTVRVFAEPTGDLLARRTFSGSLPADGPFPPLVPLTVDASTVFRGWLVDRVRVVIERNSQAPYWPLLTITNRHTNEITVVSPE
jgi:hypothetical protein